MEDCKSHKILGGHIVVFSRHCGKRKPVDMFLGDREITLVLVSREDRGHLNKTSIVATRWKQSYLDVAPFANAVPLLQHSFRRLVAISFSLSYLISFKTCSTSIGVGKFVSF